MALVVEHHNFRFFRSIGLEKKKKKESGTGERRTRGGGGGGRGRRERGRVAQLILIIYNSKKCYNRIWRNELKVDGNHSNIHQTRMITGVVFR